MSEQCSPTSSKDWLLSLGSYPGFLPGFFHHWDCFQQVFFSFCGLRSDSIGFFLQLSFGCDLCCLCTVYLDVIRGYRVIVFCSRPNYQNNAGVFFHVTLPGGAEIMIT